MLSRRRCGAALTMALLAAACSRGEGTPGLTRAWTVSSITPIGQPVAAGDTVVVYGTENQKLFLYGIAVANGTILWRQAASPSLVTSGIRLTPRVIDGLVAYLRPDPKADLAARLVVATPETGSDRLVSEPMHVGSQPAPCADGKDVCITVLDSTSSVMSRRFSVEVGGPVPDRAAPPPDSRYLGEDLLDLGQRPSEVLAGFRDGKVSWRSPLSNHFSAGYSADISWYFDLYKAAGLHVGSVGHPSDRADLSTDVTDLNKVQMAAIDTATGSSAWRAEGTSFACDARITLNRAVGEERSELWPVRCRYQGIARYDRVTRAVTYEGLDVTVEGFDVPTGKTTWSLSLGPAVAFMDEEKQTTPVTDSEILLLAATGPVIVDLGSGSTRMPEKGEAFWCATNVIFDYHETTYLPNGGASNSRRGGTLLEVCAADGSPTTAVPRRLAKSLGATVGERTVVASSRGLVAYDQRRR